MKAMEGDSVSVSSFLDARNAAPHFLGDLIKGPQLGLAAFQSNTARGSTDAIAESRSRTHKAAYAIPRSLHTSIDLPQVYKPPLQAGDVLFFGSVAHGTTAWRSDWERRTAIQFMGSRNVALAPGKKHAGGRWRSDPNNPAKLAAKS